MAYFILRNFSEIRKNAEVKRSGIRHDSSALILVDLLSEKTMTKLKRFDIDIREVRQQDIAI